MRLLPLLAAAGVLFLNNCDAPPSEPKVSVEEAWVQLPVIKGRPGAGYFTLHANNSPERLVSVTSPRIGRIELHDSGMAGGVMRMAPLRDASFSEDGELKMAPGGKHAMLFEFDPALKAGEKVPLTFTFERAPAVTFNAEVRAYQPLG